MQHITEPVLTASALAQADAVLPQIFAYHSHVYYDADTLAQARVLCEAAAQRFDLQMGHMHQRPVGPHPDWSCQLGYRPDLLNQILPWLALSRNGLVVFTHPVTGDDLRDHRDHAIWMGAVRPLKLSIFERWREGGHPI